MFESPSWLAYVGCRTTLERHARGRGLAVFQVEKGVWRPLQLLEGLKNPSFLCLHPRQPRLYAVHGDFSEISTFSIAADGLLEKVGVQLVEGFNPVHLALTPSANWLLVANHESGNVVSIAVQRNGNLGVVTHVLNLMGTGAQLARNARSHPHQVSFTPDGRYAMVPDKGLDRVFAITVDEESGHLDVAATMVSQPGSGPRHLAFHPSKPIAYIVGELDRTVTIARYEATSGHLALIASRSTVPLAVDQGSAAGIEISHDARRLYVSNRGHDSVADFEILGDGLLGNVSWLDAGKTPRFITQIPDGGPLLVAQEDGHSIAALSSDTNKFDDLVQTGSPVCIVFRKEKP